MPGARQWMLKAGRLQVAAVSGLLWAIMPGGLPEGRAQSSLELPVWKEEDADKYVEPGSTLLGRGLWPTSMLPEEGEEALKAAAEAMEGEPADLEMPADDPTKPPRDLEVPEMKLMSREMEQSTPRPAEEPSLPMPPRIVPVPAEFRDAYFADRPRSFFVDPQQMLTEQKINDIERFLDYHQEESEFAIYLLMFGPNQELPDDISLRDLHGQWFGTEPAVLMVYFFGQPERGLLEFGNEVAKTVRGRVLDSIRASCAEEGAEAENPFNQLERFAIELSIRLYWLEKENRETGAEPGGETLLAQSGAESRARQGESAGRELGRILALASALFILVAIPAAVLLWWLLRPSRRVCVFPEYEHIPRLSAPHSGGGHAVMFFGKRETEALVYGNEGS